MGAGNDTDRDLEQSCVTARQGDRIITIGGTMKRLLLALGTVAIAAIANAMAPRPATANPDPTGSWEYVCCGELCPIGDACTGTGKYICCKS
jgi:hypothetical protein